MKKETRLDTVVNGGLTWINLERPSRDMMEKEVISKGYPFHELNIEDCLSKSQVAKIEKHTDYLFILFHFPAYALTDNTGPAMRKIKPRRRNRHSNLLRFSQLSIFVGWNFVVTVQQGDLQPLNELFYQCKEKNNQKDELMGKSSGHLLHTIIDLMVDDLFHILMKIIGNLDDIEDAVFDDKSAVVKEISLLRREIVLLRRIVYPLKRIIAELTNEIQKFSDGDLAQYFNDVEDHINKILDLLESSRETIEIYKDTDFMLSSEKTNRILAVLTIWFTLSIPPVIVGTFFGMNINLPGGIEVGAWTFLGTYTTFIIVLIISVGFALAMYLYFLKVGWLTTSIRVRK
jgi:magnesium transporter